MDAFRVYQKRECHNGGKGHQKYGCSCCRMIGDLNLFKKVTRKLARSRLKQQDREDRN